MSEPLVYVLAGFVVGAFLACVERRLLARWRARREAEARVDAMIRHLASLAASGVEIVSEMHEHRQRLCNVELALASLAARHGVAAIDLPDGKNEDVQGHFRAMLPREPKRRGGW